MVRCRAVVGVASLLLVLLALAPLSISSFQSPNNPNDNIIFKPPPQPQNKRRNANVNNPAYQQMNEMLNHGILTKDEELMYGRQVATARQLRLQIDALVQEKRMENAMRRLEEEENDDNDDEEEGGENEKDTYDNEKIDYDFLSYELEYLSVYGYRPTTNNNNNGGDIKRRKNNNNNNNNNNYDFQDELLFEHVHHINSHKQQLKSQGSPISDNYYYEKVVRDDEGQRGIGSSSSTSSSAPNNRNSYSSFLLHVPIHELHENDDIITKLNIPGGKSELITILINGSYAREVLMRQNVKLVMSIAKSWMRNSASSSNKSGSSGYPSTLTQLYEGSWDKPSLDEAVQEGVIGLARAVDKYDPNVGVRFSTYATYWITSYVRNCFQRALTGCLRVPSQLHDIKAAYNQIVRDHMNTAGCDGGGGEKNVPLEQKRIARQLGISERRLHTAIRATGPLLSVDAPVVSASGSYKGSKAGGDVRNNQELLLLDTLKCAEPKPEDQVEISFLRQCLENAMATELTPYERDILRLRLGLDSGECRTVREIVELSGGIVSMADVRAAERRAFRKLRSPASVHTHNLLAYLDFTGSTIEDGT